MKTIRDDVLMALNFPTIKERADRIMFVFDEIWLYMQVLASNREDDFQELIEELKAQVQDLDDELDLCLTVHAKLNDEHEQLKVKIIELQKELESVYAQDGVKYQTPFSQ